MPKIIHPGMEALSTQQTEKMIGHRGDEYADDEASVDSTNACPKNFTLLWETGKFKTGFHPDTEKPVWHCLFCNDKPRSDHNHKKAKAHAISGRDVEVSHSKRIHDGQAAKEHKKQATTAKVDERDCGT
jgi:hypothetical protein